MAFLAAAFAIPFALVALVQMSSRPHGAKPLALLSFAAAIPLNVAAFLSSYWIPKGLAERTIMGVSGDDIPLALLLFSSFVLWMVTLGLLYEHTGAGKRALQSGSIALLVLYALGCVAMFAG